MSVRFLFFHFKYPKRALGGGGGGGGGGVGGLSFKGGSGSDR